MASPNSSPHSRRLEALGLQTLGDQIVARDGAVVQVSVAGLICNPAVDFSARTHLNVQC